MMRKFTLITFILFTFSLGKTFAQEEKKTNAPKIPSIGIHGGTLSYIGSIKGNAGSNIFTYWKPAYGFYIEKKFGSIFGVSMNGMFGKVSKSQLDETMFINFESDIMNFDLNLLLDFDNGKIINESSLFSPFFSIGVGYLTFDPYGDLHNNGVKYNHWSDGTLRDLPETELGADTASSLMVRNYEYETKLTDSLNDYARNTITIPIRLGLKFKMSPNISARISAAYILTFTEYIDNYATGSNDNLFYTSFGLQYNFVKKDEKDDKYKNFDFSEVDNMDSDGDGIIDTKDECQNTPKGVEIDNKGCAIDTDGDGVADYLDKEVNTPEGTTVNAEGVTLTAEMIAAMEMERDSVETEYRSFKAKDLTKEEVNEIQKQYEEANNITVQAIVIPPKFKGLDSDNDNYISAKEVTGGIDGFFEGENSLTAKDLNELIDFYFDQ